MPATTKMCALCKKELDLSMFGTSRGKPVPRCKQCRADERRQRYRENHTNELSWRRSWSKLNPEKAAAQQRRHYAKHREEILLKDKNKYEALRTDPERYAQHLENVRSAARLDRENLGDGYVKKVIRLGKAYSGEDITQKMVDEARIRILAKRNKRA